MSKYKPRRFNEIDYKSQICGKATAYPGTNTLAYFASSSVTKKKMSSDRNNRKNPKNYLSLAPTFFKLMTTSQNNWSVPGHI